MLPHPVIDVGTFLLVLDLIGTLLGGVLVCFALRAIAIRRGWRLPVAGEWRRVETGTMEGDEPRRE